MIHLFLVSLIGKKKMEAEAQCSPPIINLGIGFCLLGNGLDRACGDACAAIDAGTFITFCFSINHAQGVYRAYINACAAANAGFFINLYCHGVSP